MLYIYIRTMNIRSDSIGTGSALFEAASSIHTIIIIIKIWMFAFSLAVAKVFPVLSQIQHIYYAWVGYMRQQRPQRRRQPSGSLGSGHIKSKPCLRLAASRAEPAYISAIRSSGNPHTHTFLSLSLARTKNRYNTLYSMNLVQVLRIN